MPVLLINRESEIFSAVGTDNEEVGIQATNAFRQVSTEQVAVFASAQSYLATMRQVETFLDSCQQMDITILPEDVYRRKGSIALRALPVFAQRGIKVPKDVKVLTISMLDPKNTAYSTPPLSVEEMPNEEIGKASLILRKSLGQKRAIYTGTMSPGPGPKARNRWTRPWTRPSAQ